MMTYAQQTLKEINNSHGPVESGPPPQPATKHKIRLTPCFHFHLNEKGFALVTTLLILSLLTFLGMAAINTTSFELKIAGNERVAYQRFYTADSGWKQSGPFLNILATPPGYVNVDPSTVSYDKTWGGSDYIVRNYGDRKRTDIPDGEDVNTLPSGTIDGSVSSLDYWFQIQHNGDRKAAGFGTGYRDFRYDVSCNADGTAQVDTIIRKVYKVGY